MGIEELRKEIMEETEKRVREIIDDAHRRAEEILKEAERKAAEIVRRRREELIKKLKEKERAELALARIECKKIMNLQAMALVEKVYEEVKRKLIELRKSDGYKDVLATLLVEALSALNLREAVVYLNEQDKGLFRDNLSYFEELVSKKIGGNVKLIISNNSIDIIGGVIVSDVSGRTFYNNSFDAKLKESRETLLYELTSMLYVR